MSGLGKGHPKPGVMLPPPAIFDDKVKQPFFDEEE